MPSEQENDRAALIAEAALHECHPNGIHCEVCAWAWPCLPHRLALALGEAEQDRERLAYLRRRFAESGVNVRGDVVRYNVTVTQEASTMQLASYKGQSLPDDLFDAAIDAAITQARGAEGAR